MEASRDGRSMPKTTTYEPQTIKAWAVLHLTDEELKGMTEKDWFKLIGTKDARKTQAFYTNIENPRKKPWEKERVTVDRWIIRAMGIKLPPKSNFVTAKQSDAIETAIITVAKMYDCPPHQVQATVWVCVRDEEINPFREGLPF